MRKYMTCILMLIIGVILTSCTFHITQGFANLLQPTELIEIKNTTPPNLVARSKCPSPPSVRIVNVETNNEDYLFYSYLGEIYINPKKVMDSVVSYMSDAFKRTGIITDQNSTKLIQVSMEKMKTQYNFNYNFTANTQLKIMLPEKNFTQIYGNTDSTPKGPQTATVYNIHEITWKIINDPFVQDYILCR